MVLCAGFTVNGRPCRRRVSHDGEMCPWHRNNLPNDIHTLTPIRIPSPPPPVSDEEDIEIHGDFISPGVVPHSVSSVAPHSVSGGVSDTEPIVAFRSVPAFNGFNIPNISHIETRDMINIINILLNDFSAPQDLLDQINDGTREFRIRFENECKETFNKYVSSSSKIQGDCPICMESVELVQCGSKVHGTCQDCLQSWFLKGKTSCPMCRCDLVV